MYFLHGHLFVLPGGTDSTAMPASPPRPPGDDSNVPSQHMGEDGGIQQVNQQLGTLTSHEPLTHSQGATSEAEAERGKCSSRNASTAATNDSVPCATDPALQLGQPTTEAKTTPETCRGEPSLYFLWLVMSKQLTVHCRLLLCASCPLIFSFFSSIAVSVFSPTH